MQITNSCLPDVQFREGVPVTDRTGHGLGVRSICAISERYGGLTSFAAKDGQFTAGNVIMKNGYRKRRGGSDTLFYNMNFSL